MSDDDREYDNESDGGKRAHHNALERRRRDHIKDSFKELRDALPGIAGKKSSRVDILKTAAGYIQHMRRKNSATEREIKDLLRQTSILEDAIRTLENGKMSHSYADSSVLEGSCYDSTEDNMSFDLDSGSENSDTESSNGSHKQKFKRSQLDAPFRT